MSSQKDKDVVPFGNRYGHSFLFSEQCTKCDHYDKCQGHHSCKAFPKQEGIPPEIWSGEVPHTKPYPGDNGILFKKK